MLRMHEMHFTKSIKFLYLTKENKANFENSIKSPFSSIFSLLSNKVLESFPKTKNAVGRARKIITSALVEKLLSILFSF